jgi:glycosidase
VNPYNWQDHLYDKNQPENLEFLRRLRALMDEYPAATAVGEVGDAQYGLQIQAEYTGAGTRCTCAIPSSSCRASSPTPERVGEVVSDYEEAIGDGWACWAFSNHDVMRHASRWNLGEDARRLYAGLLLCLRGSVCLYQGEELGLTEAYVAYEDLQDPYGIRFWPNYKGRDGCRTPIPWISDNQNGGFSDAKPWLPMAVEHLHRAVGNQEGKADSTLAFYRAMIGFRKGYPALAKGSFTLIQANGGRPVLHPRTRGPEAFLRVQHDQHGAARRPAAGRVAAGSGRALHRDAARDRGHAAAIPSLFRRAGGDLRGRRAGSTTGRRRGHGQSETDRCREDLRRHGDRAAGISTSTSKRAS